MPLNKVTLKANLIAILSQPKTQNNVDEIATQLADAIDTYIKEATIVYLSGLTSPAGPVAGTFIGKLE